MRRLTITRLIAALTAGTFVLVAAAQKTGNRAPFWPATNGAPVVKEWYSDIPWNQKLGTYAGNRIDVPLVLPYEALGEQEKAFCANHRPPLTPEECMLETGINNIPGTLESTLYTVHRMKKRRQGMPGSYPSMHRSHVGIVQLLDSQHGLRY
jgi:hypothetical protein